MAFLTKEFKSFLKNKKERFQKLRFGSSSKIKPHAKVKNFDKKFEKKNSMEVQCFKCHGFGHMANACPNKAPAKAKKAMEVTIDNSDSSSNTSESSDEEKEEMKAMTATLSQIFRNADTSSEHEESDEEIGPKELCANLLKKSTNLSKENKVLNEKLTFMQTEWDEAMIKLQESSNKTKQLEEEISRLLIKINSLELDHEKALDEIKSLNSILAVTKRDLVLSNYLLDKFNRGSKFISNLLNAAKTANDEKGLGYDATMSSNSPQWIKFVNAKEQHT
ncbi:zinc finger protein [Macleaya cordata]|uniref:Zinc finger protein n=1 Tax=Macleaya cordata TaxID=56857 RepID=A0A200QL73_MACCD|nr:zinc finger protein [Macleaya cordata]